MPDPYTHHGPTRADLAGMSPEEINAALQSGKLNALLQRPSRGPRGEQLPSYREAAAAQAQAGEVSNLDATEGEANPGRQLTAAEVKNMPLSEINAARVDGRLDALLGLVTPPQAEAIEKASTGQTLTRDDLRHLNEAGRHDLVLSAWQAGLTTTDNTDTNPGTTN